MVRQCAWLVVVVVAVVAAAAGAATTDKHGRVGPHLEPDAFVDTVLAGLRERMLEAGLDTVALPEDQDSFDVTVFGVTLNGSLWVGEGAASGLATLHRTGNVTLDYGVLQGEISLKSLLGLTGVQVSYAVQPRIGPLGSKISATLDVPFLNVYMETNMFVYQADVVLEVCHVQDFGFVSVSLKGLGLADSPLYTAVANAALTLLSGAAETGVEAVVCQVLEQAIQGSGP